MAELPAWADPKHPTNTIRHNLRCWQCKEKGVVGKHWGQWCFKCNVARMSRLSSQFDQIADQLSKDEALS